jgi:hypothetical protein
MDTASGLTVTSHLGSIRALGNGRRFAADAVAAWGESCRPPRPVPPPGAGWPEPGTAQALRTPPARPACDSSVPRRWRGLRRVPADWRFPPRGIAAGVCARAPSPDCGSESGPADSRDGNGAWAGKAIRRALRRPRARWQNRG